MEHARVNLSHEQVAELMLAAGVEDTASLQADLLPDSTNLCYQVRSDHNSYLLRVITTPLERYVKEHVLLQRFGAQLPVARCVWFTLSSQVTDYHPVALHRWIDGMTLKKALAEYPDQTAELAVAVGTAVAQLGEIQFPRSGFLSSRLEVQQPFHMNSDGYLSYMHGLLVGSSAGTLLGRRLADRVWKCIESVSECMDGIPRQATLVHGDLHPANLIVRKEDSGWNVAGILDWEYAMAWSGVFDVAQLTDTPFDNSDRFDEYLIDAYRDGGRWCPEDWPALRGCLQLLSWIDRLSRPGVSPKMAHAAGGFIDGIVEQMLRSLAL